MYLGNLHTLANGVVSVNAHGVLATMAFPLLFRVSKPQMRLKPDDIYQSKPYSAIAETHATQRCEVGSYERIARRPARAAGTAGCHVSLCAYAGQADRADGW